MILDAHGRTAEVMPYIPDNLVRDRTVQILDGFTKELKEIRENESRVNNIGLQGLVNGVGFDGGFLGGANGNTLNGPATWALNTGYFLVTLDRQLLNYSYTKNEIVAKVIDQPVEDAFRGGVRFTSGEMDDEDLKELNRTFSSVQPRYSWRNSEMNDANVSAALDLSVSDNEAVKQTHKWARLFGGAGLIANTTQDFDTLLNIAAIGPDTPLRFIPANRWELILSGMNIFDQRYPTPFSYYGFALNRTRVARVNGKSAPDMVRRQLQGWGLSVLESSIRAINAFLKYEALIFELTDEAKIDVYKIKGFNTSLATDAGTDRVRRRVALANQLKSFSNALTIDADDDYDQKTMGTFKGIADIWDRLASNLCAYVNFPKNKLFGESAKGFSSGTDSMDTYNAMVEVVRTKAKPTVIEAGGLRCQQLFSFIPKDLDVEFEALAVLDGLQQEEVKTSQQARQVALFTAGLYDGKETSEALDKLELLEVKSAVLAGTREPEPPLSVNPDEAGAQMAHEEKMAKDKPKPGAGEK